MAKVKVGGQIELKCQICDFDEFNEREVLLNTAAMTFMNLDWLNKKARCFVCDRCGYVHWFVPHDGE